MNVSLCDQLDEYLCGWLPPDEVGRFEAHLADCAACREDCALQRRIDSLLADGSTAIAPVPADLKGRIDGGVRAAKRRRILVWTIALTAAAGVILAFGPLVREKTSVVLREEHETAQRPSVESKNPIAAVSPSVSQSPIPAVEVAMVDPAAAIVMSVESHHPNVTIVRVFPTVRVARAGENLRSP